MSDDNRKWLCFECCHGLFEVASVDLRSCDILDFRAGMDQESLVQIQEIIGAATESLRADISDARRHTDTLTEGLREELRADIADAKRHSGVLSEGLRHELQLVAEGFQMHLTRRHAEERAYLDEQFTETRALQLS